MAWDPPVFDHSLPLRAQLPEHGWRVAIAAIAGLHQLSQDDLEPYAKGETVVWRVGQHVIKLTKPDCAFQIEAEVLCLSATHGKLSLRTPRLIAQGQLSGWPYVIMDTIPGRPLAQAWPQLDHADRLRLARDLGAFCRELHALEAQGFPAGWDAFWRTVSSRVGSRHAAQGGPPALLAAIDPFLAKVGTLTSDRLVPLHTELMDQHVYVEQRDGRIELCAVLDFADARQGAAPYDFAGPAEFIFQGEAGLLRAFMLAYGIAEPRLTQSYSETLLAWSLCHRFASLARTLALIAPVVPASLEELAARVYSVAAT